MLAERIITALVGIPVVLVALYLGGLYWQAIVFVLVLTGLWEFSKMSLEGVYLDYLFLSGLSFLLITYSGSNSTKLLFWLILQLLYYLCRATFAGTRNFASAFNLLGVLYVAVPLSFLWSVRAAFGFSWTVYGLLITWATDTGAYFGGIRFGKRKLAPALSPKKSVEGAFCGCLAALALGAVFALLTQKPSLPVSGLAVLLSACGQIGDLVESALKREQSVKDSGFLLPGHGGILDRFDSLAFVFPILYIFLTFLVPRGL